MTESDLIDPNTSGATAKNPPDARKTRGIRFSDSEWEDVKTAAEHHRVPAAEFVREGILEIARGRAAARSAAVPPDLAPLIERTFRYTYMLATKMRDVMIADGKAEQLDTLVREARKLQDSLSVKASK